MTGFYLLLAHLVGDFVIQWDFLARNKANPWPGPQPSCSPFVGHETAAGHDDPAWHAWSQAHEAWWVGEGACLLHCLLYTLSVWAFAWSWMPVWGLVVCFTAHYGMDRFGTAKRWMNNVSGQKVFAEKMAPWSVVVVDNTAHLLTLGAIAALAGVK